LALLVFDLFGIDLIDMDCGVGGASVTEVGGLVAIDYYVSQIMIVVMVLM